MDDGKQILDVTYGKFSCRLEGFDDSVETMKLVVSYFHELAGHDQFMDMSLQAPDLDTLQELTEAQTDAPVEVSAEDGKLHMRALETEETEAMEEQPEASLDTMEEEDEPEDVPTDTFEFDDGVDADLVEEEADVSTEGTTPVDPLDDNATVADKLNHIRGVVSTETEAEAVEQNDLDSLDTFDADEDALAEMADALDEEPDTSEALDDTPLAEVEDDDDTPDLGDPLSERLAALADVPTAEDEAAPESEVSAEELLELVEEEEALASETPVENDLSADETETPSEGEHLEVAEAVSDLDEETGEDTDSDTLDDDLDAMADEMDALVDEDDDDLDALADAAEEVAESEDEAAVAEDAREEHSDAADEPAEQATREDKSRPLILTPMDAAPDAADGDDEAFDLAKEVAKVEAEIAARPGNEVARHGLPRSVEDAMSRILSQTVQQLNAPESKRHRDAFAQLKAAVAATEAARQLGEKSRAIDPEGAFKDDLGAHDAEERALSEADPQPPTEMVDEDENVTQLRLVASQLIESADKFSTEPVDPASEKLRRIAALKESEGVGPAKATFAEFAAQQGAVDLIDRLEAAAVYITHVEGDADFSRPSVMKVVQSASDAEITREDGLRCFGRLLRQGRFTKLNNGRFQVAENSQFRPNGDRAAQG